MEKNADLNHRKFLVFFRDIYKKKKKKKLIVHLRLEILNFFLNN